MKWRRLSVRSGRKPPEEPYEGIPGHLRIPLTHWLTETFRDGFELSTRRILAIGIHARLDLKQMTASGMAAEILKYCHADDEVFLDVLDASLQQGNPWQTVQVLREMLEDGGSAWTVSDSGGGLERRIDVAAKNVAAGIMQPTDEASIELQAAWSATYGRSPDPSDSWDHSIKAVEAVLVPLVVSSQHKAQLGHVVGHLSSQGHLWRLKLRGDESDPHSVDPLVKLLKLMWPNPDRHAGGQGRTPTLEEAESVLHVAITLVQLARKEMIERR